jgi:putative redox protein
VVELRLPAGCAQEQIDKLRVIAAKCPVHRTLDGEVMFEDRVKLMEPATT